MPFLSLKSNPLWVGRQTYLHSGPAHAPTLWDYDSNGFASPSNGRALSGVEQAAMNQYNAERASLNQSHRATVDAVLSRAMPLTDGLYNTLNDLERGHLMSDISWLSDHPAGSEFYNDPNNFVYDPFNGDDEGHFRYGRLNYFLEKSGLRMDLQDIWDKVMAGISSPIVIDLDGDGIQTTSLFGGGAVNFDIDGDGKKDRTGWISGNDAFLAVDRNENGIIDDVTELFGGAERGDGFARLAEFDSNGDGKVDKDDESFSKLLLWRDQNADGITDPGELVAASSAGLESISLNYRSQDVWQNDNLLGEVSTAVFRGREVDAVDVYFRFGKNQESSVAPWNETAMATLLISAISTFSPPVMGDSSPALVEQMSYFDPLGASSFAGQMQ